MRLIPAVMLLIFQGSVFAEAPPQSGFFDDYSRLKPAKANWADYVYVNEKYEKKMPTIKAIIIPQPEMFLSPDSEYRGMKPDNMKMITDSMQQIFAETLAGSYQIASSPGPNTMVLQMAFSNLHLKKKPRMPVVGWLPPAYVLTSLKRKMLDEFADNVLLTELVWEGQISDAQTGEVMGQLLVELGDRDRKEEFTSWDELIVAVAVAAERLKCRLENAPLVAAEQRDCLKITEEDISIVD
jgi:hypothetical protein